MTSPRRMPGQIKAKPTRFGGPAKLHDPFYSSPAWKALRKRRMSDPDYAEARRRGKKGERLILDHRIERKDGGLALDPANTQWLTYTEHQAKTAKARAERATRPLR